jgi:two-component system response regulator HydG
MTYDVPQDVLLVLDDPGVTRRWLEVLAAKGIRGAVVRDAAVASQRLAQRPWDLVVILAGPSPAVALALVREARLRDPDLPLVLVAREAGVALAVQAVREGCHDILPLDADGPALARTLEALLPAHSVDLAAAEEADSRCLYRIVGRSPRLFEAVALARKVAPTSLPVLVTGESGTGKELISYLVHRGGRRAHGPYVRVNCAALSETLLESELFGHERGAFTGAHTRRQGRFELAHGGTLLLDEISETGPRLQAQLLRVLEQQDFERVGGSESVRVNVRIVSTTNRDLAEEVRQNRFRRDLYYRLCGVRVWVPPLRERREDVPPLVWHFVNLYAREVRRRVTALDPEMMETLVAYDWPGNVRQLRNVVRTALVAGDGPTLSLAQAPWLTAELTQGRLAPEKRSLSLREVERETILRALHMTRSHQARAARLLGITDRTLREKLRRYREEGHLDEHNCPSQASSQEFAGEAAPVRDAAPAAVMIGGSHG